MISAKRRMMWDMASLATGLFDKIIASQKDEELSQVYYRVKTANTTHPGQYGYFIFKEVYELYQILRKYKCKSLIDLGAGSGILLALLHIIDYDLKLKGIEIEEKLVKLAYDIPYARNYIEQGDILQPLKLNDFDAVYFWEPFADRKLALNFVKNLRIHTHKGQYLFYAPGGYIGEYLRKSTKFKQLQHKSYVKVFKVIK